jgi:hypothetical protein
MPEERLSVPRGAVRVTPMSTFFLNAENGHESSRLEAELPHLSAATLGREAAPTTVRSGVRICRWQWFCQADWKIAG